MPGASRMHPFVPHDRHAANRTRRASGDTGAPSPSPGPEGRLISSNQMTDELEQFLASIERSDSYKVLRTLKSSAHETTELVQLEESGAQAGPFIRKRIAANSGIGQTYARLFEEQKAGRRIDSVPCIHECYVTENGLHVVMEYVTGKTLAEWVYETDASVGLAAHVFPRICDAVSELHEGFDPPVIHRDLKPSNVMIGSSGVKIIDLGIARTYRKDAEGDTRHFGTPSYAPPEQFGFGQTDARSDIYALGMLLYYCLTERTPSFSVLDSQFDDDAVPLPLRTVITKATAFDPSARYASARELKEAFLRAVDEATCEDGGIGGGRGGAAGAGPADEPASRPVGEVGGTDGGTDHWLPPYAMPHAGTTAHPPASPTAEPLAAQRRMRVPLAVGWAWNVIVFLAWGLMMTACVIATLEPTGTNAQLPTLALAVVYIAGMGTSFTLLAFMLLDKRWLRSKIPMLARASGKFVALVCASGAVAAFFAAIMVYAVASSGVAA